MVDTIKFSAMTPGGDLNPDDKTPGLLSGSNVLFNNPWTFLAPGTTGDRPIPNPVMYYRLRFNTTLEVYEYYDPTIPLWVELSGSGTGTVNPGVANDIAFYAASGQAVSPIAGAANSVLVSNNLKVPSMSTALPVGLSIPGANITTSTASLLSGSVIAAPVAGIDLTNKTYVDSLFSSGVISATGTTNQVLVNGVAGVPTSGAITLSLPQDIALGSTPTFAGLTLTSIPLGASSGGTGKTSFTAYSVICAGTTASGPLQNVSGVGTANQVLVSNGAGLLPSWQSVPGVVAAALTKTDDTNVTLTLAGTPATALLQATSLTLGWTGVLSPIRGGTGINNGTSTLTLGGSLATVGAFSSTFTMTNTTTVTFPTTGTLATTSQLPSGAALTKTDDTNVTLTLAGSPTTALVNAASLTLGWTGTLAVTRGGTGVSSVTTAPTVTAFAGWDANKNLSANSLIPGFATTVTAAGNTVLTVASKQVQEFTGTSTQTVTMPVASTLVAGQQYVVINNSSGNVTVNSSGGNAIGVMAANTTLYLDLVLASGTTAASWNGSYVFDNGAGVLSITGTANQVIASASTGAVTLSLPQSIATSSAVQFASVQLGNTGILDANAHSIISLSPAASSVNSFTITNANTGSNPQLLAVGSDANVGINIATQAAGLINLVTAAPTVPLNIYSGTGSQHITAFSFSNTSATRTVTFPDASGTLALETDGTWTPVATFATPGDLSVVYTRQIGKYTKIGNLYFIYIDIAFTPTFTTASGNFSITGAPVTPANNIGLSINTAAPFIYPASHLWLSMSHSASTNAITITSFASAVAAAILASTAFTSGTPVVITANGVGSVV